MSGERLAIKSEAYCRHFKILGNHTKQTKIGFFFQRPFSLYINKLTEEKYLETKTYERTQLHHKLDGIMIEPVWMQPGIYVSFLPI